MRLSDLEKLIDKPQPRTREADISVKDLLGGLKRDDGLAREKLEEIPAKTKEEMKPLFSPSFWQLREA